MHLRNNLGRVYTTLLASAFIFGFVPASCYAHFADGANIASQAHQPDQCVVHKLNSRSPDDERLSRLNVPLPKPLNFLPTSSTQPFPRLTSLKTSMKLSVAEFQRMRVPIQRMSMPFKVDGFLPYFMAMRDG